MPDAINLLNYKGKFEMKKKPCYTNCIYKSACEMKNGKNYKCNETDDRCIIKGNIEYWKITKEKIHD